MGRGEGGSRDGAWPRRGRRKGASERKADRFDRSSVKRQPTGGWLLEFRPAFNFNWLFALSTVVSHKYIRPTIQPRLRVTYLNEGTRVNSRRRGTPWKIDIPSFVLAVARDPPRNHFFPSFSLLFRLPRPFFFLFFRLIGPEPRETWKRRIRRPVVVDSIFEREGGGR